ncbi:MAG: substrate-binding domain-containing protein, partial [Thermoleophilia bacterium]|nr:substrate-binding domain-containing protein [Thermoleophilia bacterium]
MTNPQCSRPGWYARGGQAPRGWRRRLLAIFIGLGVIPLLAASLVGCGQSGQAVSSTATAPLASPSTSASTAASTATTGLAGASDLVLASTTSTQDSGLFNVLIPAFNQAYPQYRVKVVAVGSGEALKLGETGDADVLLVHSPDAEKQFMAQGFGVERKAVMYNDFIIVGPPDDPAGIKGMKSAAQAFAAIAQAKATFYSRGDNSGTHSKEKAVWKAAGISPAGSWYKTTGQGMGETLTIADQTGGYTLTDRGTYLSRKDSLGLQVLVEGDKALFNQYHVITVKKAR